MQTDNRSWIIMTLKAKNISTIFETFSRFQSYRSWFVDWGNADNYVKAVGVGECAGVVIDLVATLLLEAKTN
jgi:hypothetical protein